MWPISQKIKLNNSKLNFFVTDGLFFQKISLSLFSCWGRTKKQQPNLHNVKNINANNALARSVRIHEQKSKSVPLRGIRGHSQPRVPRILVQLSLWLQRTSTFVEPTGHGYPNSSPPFASVFCQFSGRGMAKKSHVFFAKNKSRWSIYLINQQWPQPNWRGANNKRLNND